MGRSVRAALLAGSAVGAGLVFAGLGHVAGLVAKAAQPPSNPPHLMVAQVTVPPTTAPPATAVPPSEAPPDFDQTKVIDKARQITRMFADRIKSELTTTIKAEGAANAVSLCQTISPDISTQLSDESGFEVTRTSLRLRNPESMPGPWELGVLKQFEAKVAAGTDPAKLEYSEVVVMPEGDKLFRYMKGIPVIEVCLNCHGTDIKADVRAELARYYPDDKATGYQLGELRGAFSLVKLIGP